MVIYRSSPCQAVTQTAHAWVSAQIGRAWGNEDFTTPPLMEELIHAAAWHDIGHLDWDLAPTLDRKTGLPHTYMTIPHATHVQLWNKAIDWMEQTSRFCALMISLHAHGLYRKHFVRENETEQDCRIVDGFLGEQREFQTTLRNQLIGDPRYAHLEDNEKLEEYVQLLGTWDVLSLSVCENTSAEKIIDHAPGEENWQSLKLIPMDAENHYRLRPWPFAKSEIRLSFEGRPLNAAPYQDEKQLHEDLHRSENQSIEVNLKPS